jgi:hypothetical protein
MQMSMNETSLKFDNPSSFSSPRSLHSRFFQIYCLSRALLEWALTLRVPPVSFDFDPESGAVLSGFMIAATRKSTNES